MKFRLLSVAAASVVALSLVAGDAAAQVIYSDSFDRTTGSGDPNGNPAGAGNGASAWEANDNVLGGSVVNTWLVGPARGGGANQVTNGSLASTIEGGAHYVFDVTSVAPNGFKVEFDFNRFHPINPGNGNGFLAIGLGADTGAVIGGGGFVPNNSDLTLLFQQAAGPNSGNMQILEDNVFAGGTAANGDGPVDYGDPTVGHSVQLTLVPASSGAYGSGDTINGSVSIDGGTAYNFSVLGGTEFGNLAFSSNGFVHRSYDNLVVTAIPEPSTLVLAGLAMLAGVGRRRRLA